ncbi:uncharacterized protein LOC106644251 [Copidosoma floridanum]|uniref:uncharacterized protein LOC106644251 n=1 Tax=Copidosoma floridanum TaxID=29053 RepID=UPI0006C963B5|nr:uncharacterized protein LOC106644251 [Copidosoma floridanum]
MKKIKMSHLRLRDNVEVKSPECPADSDGKKKIAKVPSLPRLRHPVTVKHCCVKGCKSNSNNRTLHFYVFPSPEPINSTRRKLWIQAVISNCNFSEDWQPMKLTLLCNKHFVGGVKNDNPQHPAYTPTLFPDPESSDTNKKETKVKKLKTCSLRQDNTMEKIDHNYSKVPENMDIEYIIVKEEISDPMNDMQEYESVFIKEEIPVMVDFSCQADILYNDKKNQHLNYMTCSKIVENGLICAETQARLKQKVDSRLKVSKKVQSSSATTTQNLSFGLLGLQSVNFQGITTIHSNNDLLHMCGVSFKVFNLLLKNLPPMEHLPIGNANRLLIFLMKLKQGMDYFALAVIFGLSPQKVTEMCLITLKHFASILKIKWPNRDFVRSVMPDVFKKSSPTCRAIIDCVDVHVEVPDNEHERITFYATYKNWYNFKFFLACAPNGAITYKTTCYLDQKPDELLVNESEFFDLLQKGDTVLGNREFPDIRPKLESMKVTYFSPPFTENPHLDPLDISVKQCINRIRSFKIISAMPSDLFLQVDEVVHICCCLINLELMKKN